jgi:tripartite-type tricarboxylate transporter receptor subunit TctC
MLEAGRFEELARQAAQEVHEQLQEGLTALRRTVIAKFAAALVALVAFGGPQPSHAQGWPAKPVKIVVAFAPGGAADLFARLLAAEMSTTFNQQFYVENVAGSAGAIGTGQAARAQPDGYTLLIGGAGPLLTSPAINPRCGISLTSP